MTFKPPSIAMFTALRRLSRNLLGQTASDGKYATLPADDIPWEIPLVPSRIVAVGDLHGDLGALAAILLEASLIDEAGRWSGRNAHLVLVGDLVRGSRDSRLVMDFVMRLEEEAARAGGAVHSLLGNHDLLTVREKKPMRGAEKKLFKSYSVPGADGTRLRDAFRGHTPYARWFRRRNAILRIGETIFVHAGLGDWALEHDPGRVNATIRAWIRYFQGLAEKPPKNTRWTVGTRNMARGGRMEMGPLWTRAFKPVSRNERPAAAPKRKKLEEILAAYGASRMVVGHAPIDLREILLEHPYYESLVVMIDTRISAKRNGRLSCLEILGGTLRPLYCKRSEESRRVRQLELDRLKGASPAAASWAIARVWERFTRFLWELFR